MEKKEFQLDYKLEEEPLLVLPLCVGAMLLSGELFGWLNSLDPDGLGDDHLAAFRILYWGFLLSCSVLAVWRLARTIHATEGGLEYRFLGRVQKLIPWTEFSCAAVGRARQMKMRLVFLIPEALGPLPGEPSARYRFLTNNYHQILHFHATKNNRKALSAFLRMEK